MRRTYPWPCSTSICQRFPVGLIDDNTRVRRRQELHVITLESWYASRKDHGMGCCIIHQELMRCLDIVKCEAPGVALSASISLFLWGEAMFSVVLDQRCQAVLADAIMKWCSMKASKIIAGITYPCRNLNVSRQICWPSRLYSSRGRWRSLCCFFLEEQVKSEFTIEQEIFPKRTRLCCPVN